MLILECPNCQSCFTVEMWNIQPKIGEPIPENLETSEDWDNFTFHNTGMVDCPECGEVAVYDDMLAV